MLVLSNSGKFRRLLIVAGTAAVVVSFCVPSTAASAGTPRTQHEVSLATPEIPMPGIPESKDWDDHTRAQIARTQFLYPTFRELSQLSGFVDGGYTDPESNVLEVKWVGSLPDEAMESIKRAKERGLDTVVVFVEHSEEEVLSRATRLSAALYAEGISVWTLVPSDDYSHLDISGPNLEKEGVDRIAHQIGDPIMGDIPFRIVPWDESRGRSVNFDAGS